MQVYKPKKSKAEQQYIFEQGSWNPIVLAQGNVSASIGSHNCNYVRIDQFIYFTIELQGIQFLSRNRYSPYVSLPFQASDFQHPSGFFSKAYIHEITDAGNPTTDPIEFDSLNNGRQRLGFIKIGNYSRSFNNGGTLKISGHFYSPYIKLE